jgi:hypothetical protein
VVVDDQRLGRKEPNMIIIGVDYHPSDQYIAFVDTETESAVNGDGTTEREKPRSFIGNWRHEESACAWGWRPPAIPAGSSGC